MSRAICPRCKREAVGWLLRRPDICSPSWWVNCIRHPRPEWVVERTPAHNRHTCRPCREAVTA